MRCGRPQRNRRATGRPPTLSPTIKRRGCDELGRYWGDWSDTWVYRGVRHLGVSRSAGEVCETRSTALSQPGTIGILAKDADDRGDRRTSDGRPIKGSIAAG